MTDAFWILYSNCLRMVRFRFSETAQMTSSGLPPGAIISPPPANFGLTDDKFRHEMTTAGYVMTIHNYLCVLIANPDKTVSSKLPDFRKMINATIKPELPHMRGVREIIIVVKKDTDNFHGAISALYPTPGTASTSGTVPDTGRPLIRFVTPDIFALDLPNTPGFGVSVKKSQQDIDRDKKFSHGPAHELIIRHDDVRVIWYGYNRGDIITFKGPSYAACVSVVNYLVA